MRIFSLLFASGLICASLAAPQQSYNYNPYLSQPTTTPAPILHPPAQVHYVNIGQELNGDYKFGYDTGKGPSGQSFREETRLQDGTVKGQYGYLDAQNKMRIVKYTAGLNGFQIDSDSALSEQQLAASRPSQPVQAAPQPAPQQQHQQAPPSPYYQPAPAYQPKPPAYQGLASAASSQPASIAHYAHPSAYQQQQQPSAYAPQQPSPPAQQPYTGYPAAPQAYAPSYTANPSSAYAPNQLTPAQLQQQALLAARARQAALARQQQQEAVIRQQQQAATEAILAQQRAASQAHAQAVAAQQQASQQQPAQQYPSSGYSPQQYAPQQYAPQQYAPQQPSYSPSQSYAAQPSYASQQPYTSPVTASAAAAATSAGQAAPQQQPSYAPRQSASTELKPDLLSNFIQLPGVKLIQLDRKPAPKQFSSYSPNLPSGSFGLNSAGTASTTKPEDDYQGPVVINAALLSYNIGANQQAAPAAAGSAQNKKA